MEDARWARKVATEQSTVFAVQREDSAETAIKQQAPSYVMAVIEKNWLGQVEEPFE